MILWACPLRLPFSFFFFFKGTLWGKCNFVYVCLLWRINKSIKSVIAWWDVLAFYSLFILTLFFIGMPTLSGCPFILMELGIKNGLDVWKENVLCRPHREALLSCLDTARHWSPTASSPVISRLSPNHSVILTTVLLAVHGHSLHRPFSVSSGTL